MKPILLIRPDSNAKDAEALAQLGIASTIEPLLQIVPASDPEPAQSLARELTEAASSTWLLVTSPRTWDLWREQVTELDSLLTAAIERGLQVATVGAATTASLPALARDRTVTPPGISADDLLVLLLDRPASTALLPTSARARRKLPDGLRGAGWRVHQAEIYDTVPRFGVRLPQLDELGGVLVRSASAASALAGLAPRLPAGFAVFAVGPITAARCSELGWRPVEIDSTNPAAIAETILRHETRLRTGPDGSMLEA